MRWSRESDLFSKIMKQIKRVREPGEGPKSDLIAIDKFECDLCKGTFSGTEIIQCPYCGRWVCREHCLDHEDLACLSCMSVIKLYLKTEEVEADAVPVTNANEGALATGSPSPSQSLREKRTGPLSALGQVLTRRRTKPKTSEMQTCDLCNREVEPSESTRCPYCERHVCVDACWVSEKRACINCAPLMADQQPSEPVHVTTHDVKMDAPPNQKESEELMLIEERVNIDD